MTTNIRSERGFTVVELLVVIVVFALLSLLVINVVQDTRLRARNASAARQLKDIEQAVFRLAVDTGKWPNGCPPDSIAQPEGDIEGSITGLVTAPPVGIVHSSTGCQWETLTVANWFGPYVSDATIQDPWGNSYRFDPDYYPYQSCSSIPNEPVAAVVVSYGPDGTEYTCDDIFRVMTD